MPPLTLHALAERWRDTPGAERANFQTYLRELCEALGVEPPGPAGSGYEFELPIKLVSRDGTETAGFVDCWRQGCFALEAKDEEPGRSGDALLRKAFGQVHTYAVSVGGPLAVPRHRDQAVGAGDRGAGAVDRVPPVLEGAPPHPAAGADPPGHGDAGVP